MAKLNISDDKKIFIPTIKQKIMESEKKDLKNELNKEENANDVNQLDKGKSSGNEKVGHFIDFYEHLLSF